MRFRFTILCSSALLLSLLSACGSGGDGATLGQPGDASEADRTIELEAEEFKFSMDEISVEPGETIEFVVRNVGQVQHEFAIGDEGEHAVAGHGGGGSTGPIDPGDSAMLVWSFPDSGEVEFACHIDSHDEQGMVGTLTVTG